MHSPLTFFPRRYYVDPQGRRVLVGLTVEETSEFELLDARAPFSGGSDTARNSSHEKRWHELYQMHEEAWKIWMSKASEGRCSRSTKKPETISRPAW